MHMKWNMLWLFAIFTLSPIYTANISIFDSISNTTFNLHTFHLWDRPDGQSRGLKLGAKKSPLRIYYPAVTCIFLCAANPINTHSPVRNGPDRYPNTTSTLMRILTPHRGGGRKACLGNCTSDKFSDDDTRRTENTPPPHNDTSSIYNTQRDGTLEYLQSPIFPICRGFPELYSYYLTTTYQLTIRNYE